MSGWPLCKFLVITKINGEMYYFGQAGIAFDNMKGNATMVAMSADDIKAKLKDL